MSSEKLSRPKSFFVGTTEIGFTIEQAVIFAGYFLSGIAALSVGAWGLAAIALALSVAPARAVHREFTGAGENLSHAFRRKH